MENNGGVKVGGRRVGATQNRPVLEARSDDGEDHDHNDPESDIKSDEDKVGLGLGKRTTKTPKRKRVRIRRPRRRGRGRRHHHRRPRGLRGSLVLPLQNPESRAHTTDLFHKPLPPHLLRARSEDQDWMEEDLRPGWPHVLVRSESTVRRPEWEAAAASRSNFVALHLPPALGRSRSLGAGFWFLVVETPPSGSSLPLVRVRALVLDVALARLPRYWF
ncbi:hypothetical protein C8Q73DRAFT_48301 [Cubamyces lactineus]|nr:hypothetical protein C8Q73DRAFT_48301 [Cubamyces lactineus]